jgi:hypothetical protein
MSSQIDINLDKRTKAAIYLSQWFFIPLFMFYLQIKIMDIMKMKYNDDSGFYKFKLLTIMIFYNFLCTLVLWGNEFIANRGSSNKKWYHIFPYIIPIIAWFLILFTLLLTNIKKVIGLDTAHENTLNLILWLTVIIIIIQTITKRFLKLKYGGIDNDSFTDSLYSSWVPVSFFGVITLSLLFFLLSKNRSLKNNLLSFMIPFLIVLSITIGGILWTNSELAKNVVFSGSPIMSGSDTTSSDKKSKQKIDKVTIDYDTN